MYVIKTERNEYITGKVKNWLDLLNETSYNEKEAYKFITKDEVTTTVNKLMKDGYNFMGDNIYGYFEVKEVK